MSRAADLAVRMVEVVARTGTQAVQPPYREGQRVGMTGKEEKGEKEKSIIGETYKTFE